jgi:type IV pilus assembly protein PilM
MASTIVGIDIGSTSVRAVEVSGAEKAKPTIVRSHEVQLPEGSVRRGEVLEVNTVASALRKLWSSGGFKSKDVSLGMGGQRVFARDLVVPRASLSQIRESLPFLVQDQLPVPVADTILDFYPISEETTDEGPMVSGLLIAAIKESVSSNVAAVMRAGLNPVHVDLIPFALTRALAPVHTNTGLSVLLGVGANTTNVIVAQDGVPQFVRIITSGGDDITRALSTGLQVDLAQAEALKRSLGLGSAASSPQARPALDIIYGVVGELLNNVRNTLSYYTNSKKNVVLERIIASGGVTQMPGFTAALTERIGLPVVEAEPLGAQQLARSARSGYSREKQDTMSTAFGLALGTVA